jgi:hypothetical protein
MPQNQREISSHNSPRCPTIWNHSLILMLDSTKYALQSPINYISPRWSNTYMLQKFLCSQKYISPREIERRRLTQRGRRCTEVIPKLSGLCLYNKWTPFVEQRRDDQGPTAPTSTITPRRCNTTNPVIPPSEKKLGHHNFVLQFVLARSSWWSNHSSYANFNICFSI